MSVYKDALNKWGITTQLNIAKEELAELIVAISHYQRNKKNSFIELCEEIADVEIMLSQIKADVLIGLDRNKVKNAKAKKLKRLRERLKEPQNE